MHTGEIVEFSQDFFEQDIVFNEMKKFSQDNDDVAAVAVAERGDDDVADGKGAHSPTRSPSGNIENDENGEEDVDGPELVEHYLVFVFTLWEKPCRR